MTELKRVMCVEDDPDIRLILKFSLERLGGFTLCLCSSGYEALEKVQTFASQLVLLDVMMPKLSGPQTLKQLRALEIMRGIPVVFLTAKAMRNEVEALLEHGSTGIIVKPFDPVTLPKDVLIYWQHGRG
ncbi:Alkaline phosphatase synthesis transcriptional regulatory protein PhoP [Polaromonas vacuolata]|uniref:Alkaline phosphatase synthesis transcriptional regulatory protein PhoP n=1 Tax=Polaromonas vacuolata TaxID=37448 RepID=A0A6H2HDK9_9BURK|nr:response regulator [Polaromonas vacuolata]QJC57847.1 Alkaline phosphatase synthesis transcriptional regulatory protein PhoP [Polaromonas vacuolata]